MYNCKNQLGMMKIMMMIIVIMIVIIVLIVVMRMIFPGIKKDYYLLFSFSFLFSFFPGIEKEFDQRLMPDGKCNIDGFLCVFDVSIVPNRTLEKQVNIIVIIIVVFTLEKHSTLSQSLCIS